MSLGFCELDVLLFVLENSEVRKLFIDEARSWDHSLADSRAMYSMVHRELCKAMTESLK